MTSKVKCPYCGIEAVLRDSKIVYGRNFGQIWICSNYPACDSYVGCHKGTSKPLGTLANAELRSLRKATHELIDPLWREGDMERRHVYAWLRYVMNMREDDCHIGKFTKEQCEAVADIFEHPTLYQMAALFGFMSEIGFDQHDFPADEEF